MIVSAKDEPNMNYEWHGTCCICDILIGYNKYKCSELYHVKNDNSLYLRRYNYYVIFSGNERLAKLTFCKNHAIEVEEERKHHSDWDKME